MENKDNFLESCLFFNTNSLSRNLLKLAEKEFKPLFLSPAHASLLLLVYNTPYISPKQLSHNLCLSPSTITRFIDALEKKNLVLRKTKGKTASIVPSKKGLALKKPVAQAYKRLYQSYTKILGNEKSKNLSYMIFKANKSLSQSSDNNNE